MRSKFTFITFLFAILFFSCQKELSFENGGVPGGGSGGTALYSFNGGTASCTGAILSGTFTAGTPATAANNVVLEVTVDSAGTYSVTTNPVNGISFSGSGTFDTAGVQTITLTANGTPTAAGTFNFTPASNSCTFSVTVAPNNGGGSGTAVFSFDGGNASCTGAVVNGTFTAGTVVTAANTVVLNVSVDTVGTYSVTTASADGITFSGSGTFTTTGAQTITLAASGTPAAAGDYNFTAGAAGCIFSVTVVPSSSGGTDYIRCTIDGVNKTFNEGAFAVNLFGIVLITGVDNASSPNAANFSMTLSNTNIDSAGTFTEGVFLNLPPLPGKTCLIAYIPDAASSDPGWGSATAGQSGIFTVTVTSITANRIQGTFTGTLYDNEGNGTNTKTITNGEFSVPQ